MRTLPTNKAETPYGASVGDAHTEEAAMSIPEIIERLKADALQPHPNTWTPEKVQVKHDALVALEKYSQPNAERDLVFGAFVFEDIARRAYFAGAQWFPGYALLAELMMSLWLDVTPHGKA